ncbi:MAG: dipeptidyl aminopeptidase [Massilia sp.]|nr:dipeptidyl aminopeptidase [Massilia sp.]
MKTFRRLSGRILLCLSLAWLAATAACAADARPPIESFFQNPGFSSAVLAPDARHLAVRIGTPGRRDALATVNLADMSVKVVAFFTDTDVGQFEWVNNERLIFDTTDKELGAGDREYAPGLFAANLDGSKFRQLASRRGELFIRGETARPLLPWHTYMVRQKGAQDSEYVYVTSPMITGPGQVAYVDLLRLNTLTGRTAPVKGPANTQHWLLDHKGEPRIARAEEAGVESFWYREPASAEWRKLVEFDAYKGGPDAFDPLAFGPDGTLYARAQRGADKRALYRVDLAAGKVGGAPLVRVENFDFQGSLVTTRERLLGVRVLSDAEEAVWFDPAMQALQERVDRLLPRTVNLLSVAARAETPWLLVQSYSDVQPRFITLFNSESGELKKVGDTYPGIDPARMGKQKLVRYKARDGLEIPAWLTLPNGSDGKNLPLVVLVHGGPYVRGGQWGWNPQSQFLASRGYAVLEPEYRGSTGFGSRHYRAGWKQWGLKMQDDIADGAKWAIAEGIVDPKRICIAGASYGGYATLMGLLNDPGLYQCGIDWVGVTDIKLLQTGHWSFTSDLSDRYRKYGMPELVGDLVKDAAQLDATSPLLQAARITKPLLLAYGGADKRVPLYHGKKFYEAVKRNNPDVEWVLYPDEGHGWALPKTRIDFWSRVEKFLDKNIGKP